MSTDLEKLMDILHDLEYVPPKLIKRMLSGVLWEGDPASKAVSLTFDDGPDPDVTPKVLDTLDRYGATGSFFLTGKNVKRYPELARTIVECGHDIGSHGMNHDVFMLRRRRDVLTDISESLRVIEEHTGCAATLFRPPHGLFDFTTIRVVKRLKLRMVLWSLLSGDYREGEPVLVLDRVKRYMHPGAIIVFHDTVRGGGNKLPEIIDSVCAKAREDGLGLVGVHEHAGLEGIQ